MTILQQPDALSLSQNLKEFHISSDVQVSFILKQGGVEILSQRYDPSADGHITINLRDIVHARLSYQLIESGQVYEQSSLASDFTAVINDTTLTFRVIRSGIDRLADSAANFLTQNFLTWQPSIKPVTYYSPEFLTYYATIPCVAKLRAYFTDTSGSVISQTDYTVAEMVADIAYTMPLQYSVVAGWLGHKLPAYYDVWVENLTGQRLTYIQRYYAEDMRTEQEQWILFENSLGGLDTFRAYGTTTFSGEHTHNLAEIDEVSQEYRVDTERKFQKNTGHLNQDERKWLLDFFPSQAKYLYTGNYLRQIVVTESNVSYTDRTLPSNYTFTFKYADARPLLNLPRTDIPADVLSITVPEVGSFTVPPRLAEFPRLPLSEGALFPIQNPYSEKWGTTTAEAVATFIGQLLSELAGSGGGIGHTHRNIDLLNILSYIREYLLVGGQKIKAGYADEAGYVEGMEDLFLSSVEADFAQEIITFLKGLLIGENGSGITVLENGMSQAVVDYLYVRVKAVFDELEIKRKTYVGGEQIISPAGMKCNRVEEMEDVYRCYFKAEEEGIEINNQFTVGTLAIAQECNIKTGVSQHVGNRYYWRLVTAVGTDYIDLSKTICDPNVENDIPAAGDDIVGLGHKTDITRQAAIILSSVNEVSPSILMYQGINDFTLTGKEVIAFDYDKSTGKAQMRVYGDTYIGAKDESEYISYKDGRVNIKGRVHIEPESTGAGNLSDLPDFIQQAQQMGTVNLLRNSGFTGDYETEELSPDTELTSDSEMYSKALEFWTGMSTVEEDATAVSGRSAVIGSLSQSVVLINQELYVISYQAKGESVAVSCGDFSVAQPLTSEYKRYKHSFTFSGAGVFMLSGTATVCDVQLERGTIATDWKPSPLDNDKSMAEFQSLSYIYDVLKNGSVDIIGGLILSSMIQLGNYKDGKMQKVTAGISGVYNDNDDVYTWGGGTFEQAIRTVMKYKNNPKYQPTEEELKTMANAVITHGGRAILNDVILRGYVYALGGYFRGAIEQADGFNKMNEDGSVDFCGGKIRWGTYGNPVIEGKLTTSLNGTRIEIDPESNSNKMYNQNNKVIGSISFMTEEWNGMSNFYPRIELHTYHDDEAVTTIAISGNNITMSVDMGNDNYFCRLEPRAGLSFYKNDVLTKNYPAS